MEDIDVKLEIEDVDKSLKQKMAVVDDDEIYIFFGVYCSQSSNLVNHKDIKVSIYWLSFSIHFT